MNPEVDLNLQTSKLPRQRWRLIRINLGLITPGAFETFP